MRRRDTAGSRAGKAYGTRISSGYATLPQWRRIALERQLPRPRFPGGIGVPSAIMLVCLVVIGACTAAYFLRPPAHAVPRAVIDSQRDLVVEVSHRLSVGSRRDQEDAHQVAAAYATDPAHDPRQFVAATAAKHLSWHSVAIWDPASGAVLGTAGEALPPEVLKAATRPDTVTGFVGADQRGRLLHVAKLTDGKLLAVVVPVSIRSLRLEPGASQSVMLVLDGKTLIQSQGTPVAADDPVRTVIARAGGAKTPQSVQGNPVTTKGQSRVPVVSSAPVGGTPFAVASTTYIQPSGADASKPAALLGGVLVLLAIVGYLSIQFAFVRPLRRLLGDAKRVACGEPGGASRLSRLPEAQRVGAAFGALAAWQPVAHRGTGRSPVRASSVLSIAAAAIVLWSVGLFVVVRDASTVPAQVAADYQNHADHVANALRDTFDETLSNLEGLATRSAATDKDQDAIATRLLSSFIDDNPRIRSAYLLGPNGRTRSQAGHDPLRRGTWKGTAPGLVLDQENTSIPLVLAHVPYGSGQLVAEFDPVSLRSVLDQVHGGVHVVDHQLRSVLDTGGFIAFSQVHDSAVRAAATAVVSSDHPATAPTSNRRVVVASVMGDVPADGASTGGATTVGTAQPASPSPTSPSSALGWIVVVSLDSSDMALPRTQALHVAWLLAVLAVTVAVATWAWHYTIFARPLKTLAAAAERLTAGDHKSPITPERFDDVGALAMCLEVCRQAYVDGSERLAGVPRLRGSFGDQTVVLPAIKA